jgi:propionyl-CoA carboxylase beta chain
MPIAGIDWMFRLEAIFSGAIPQITVLMGPCIAGGAYVPTLCDFLFISRVSGNLRTDRPQRGRSGLSHAAQRNL